MLIVQQRLETAIAPVENLGPRLLREGLAALAMVIAVTSVLWWFVVQMLRERVGRSGLLGSPELDSSMHSRDTLPSPGVK
jgi:hypothetical protein